MLVRVLWGRRRHKHPPFPDNPAAQQQLSLAPQSGILSRLTFRDGDLKDTKVEPGLVMYSQAIEKLHNLHKVKACGPRSNRQTINQNFELKQTNSEFGDTDTNTKLV